MKKIDPFIIGIVTLTIIVLGGAIYFGTKTTASVSVAANDQATLSIIGPREYDWGTIDYNGGNVFKKFKIKNTGKTALKLYNVKTSCMCTTAQLKTATTVSRKYGMHEQSNDVFKVDPGKTVDLIVEFDPTFHGPKAIGPIARAVTLNTNDANNPILTFNLTADVVRK